MNALIESGADTIVLTDLGWVIVYTNALILLLYFYTLLSILYDVITASINAISFTYCVLKSGIEQYDKGVIESKPDYSSTVIARMLYTSFNMFFRASDVTIISDYFTWEHAFKFSTFKYLTKQQEDDE